MVFYMSVFPPTPRTSWGFAGQDNFSNSTLYRGCEGFSTSRCSKITYLKQKWTRTDDVDMTNLQSYSGTVLCITSQYLSVFNSARLSYKMANAGCHRYVKT